MESEEKKKTEEKRTLKRKKLLIIDASVTVCLIIAALFALIFPPDKKAEPYREEYYNTYGYLDIVSLTGENRSETIYHYFYEDVNGNIGKINISSKEVPSIPKELFTEQAAEPVRFYGRGWRDEHQNTIVINGETLHLGGINTGFNGSLKQEKENLLFIFLLELSLAGIWIFIINYSRNKKSTGVKSIKPDNHEVKQIMKCEHCGRELTNDNYSPASGLCRKCYYKGKILNGFSQDVSWKFDEETKNLLIYGSGCLTELKNEIDRIRSEYYDPHNLGSAYEYPGFFETDILKGTVQIVIRNGVDRIDPDGKPFFIFLSVQSILIPPSVTYISDKFCLRFPEDRKEIRVIGVKGSYAENYSKDNNMIFEPIEMSAVL